MFAAATRSRRVLFSPPSRRLGTSRLTPRLGQPRPSPLLLGQPRIAPPLLARPVARLLQSSSPLASVVPGYWTGLEPPRCPGFEAETQTLSSLRTPDLRQRGPALREALEHYFENGWTLTEVLFSSLSDEAAFYRPPAHGLRHAMIFYYGHPAALAINKLRVAGAIGDGVEPRFEVLFETGVDEMSWDDLDTPQTEWPPLCDVTEYRRACREARTHTGPRTLNAAGLLPLDPLARDAPTDANAVVWALGMICEHERIHLETSTTLIRELPLESVTRPQHWPFDHASAWQRSAGEAVVEAPQLRRPRTHATYSWDNEYGRRTIGVEAFAFFWEPVGQFLAFVRAGGYASPELWTEEGWAWRSFRNTKWPHFWGLHQYKLRLPFAETAQLPAALPAEVNKHEACARDAARDEALDDAAAADAPGLRARGLNLGLAFGSPSDVSGGAQGALPFASLAGNCWEYCEDWFAALPGFKVSPLYEDFSTPCFDGQHALIVGGSFAATGNEASVFSRFHFRPHFHNLVGFRAVR
ncbi:hypothetical protein EMIHUDRAFT_73662, partial [Emiliania huxleyi CCMP1516]|uniref:Sulfatase-modifying factor enzyme-like domain-containing protein n=2 Tax=Emiliania huxleyi TaxID=2903 RepID=A0A0D3JRI8_EMIH1